MNSTDAAGDRRLVQPKLPKRDRFAGLCSKTGITRLLNSLPQSDCLVVLNYHRIGWPEQSPYDPGVFSATPEDFSQQVSYLKRNFHVVTLDEAVAYALNGAASKRGTRVLITFDDGYRDNYDHAFPILEKHQVQGTFFLCTTFVGSHRLPWWDRIAHMLRRTDQAILHLCYPDEIEINIGAEGFDRTLRRLLTLYKTASGMDTSRFLAELGEAAGVKETDAPERLFLDWQEAQAMVGAGMAIGSHTHTHEILSHLTAEQQVNEVEQSRRILQNNLGIPIDTLAYPVGAPISFSTETFGALEQSHYRAAFSFYGGVNRRNCSERYNLRRIAVDNDISEPLFRLRTSLTAFAGRQVI